MADVPVSRKFLFDLDELYTKRKAKEITEEEFSIQRDALVAQEAKSQEAIGPVLIAKELERIEAGVENTVSQKFQQEEQEENERLTREKYARIAEKQRIEKEERDKQDRIRQENQRKLNNRIEFRESINGYVDEVEHTANQWQRRFNWLQVILIILTTATASMAGFNGVSRGYVVIVGFAAAALGGILSFFQLQDKIYSSRKALADLHLECQMYDHYIDEYKNRLADPEGAYLVFSKKVTAIKAQHMLREVELLNPRKKDISTGTDEDTKPDQEKKGDSQAAKGDQSADSKADATKEEVQPASS